VGRQVVSTRIQGDELWEVGGQVGGDDLEDALGLGQVLEAVLPEVQQAAALGQGVSDETGPTSESSTCPPWPIASNRAARFSGGP
jgi:hypothetical protein